MDNRLRTFDGKVVPDEIGHGYIPLEIHPLSYLSILKNHRRLRVFHSKGVACAIPGCTREGFYVILAIDRGGGMHFDVYTKDFHLMTVDHIHPKSKGGKEDLSNKQPMCSHHNGKKGNKIPSEIEIQNGTREECSYSSSNVCNATGS